MKRQIFTSACAVVALTASGTGHAQVGPPAAPDAGVPLQQQATAPSPSAGVPAEQAAPSPASDGLQDIIVTAQRRTENLQTVPVSATALSAQGLTEKAVTRLSDLQFAAPSLSVSDNGLTQQANIRGIGLASGSPSVANGVATYLDGLFQPPIVGTGAFYDISSVEVFRGPQGTLVGSNSTGGAIFINTQNPKFDKVGGYAEATYGNYNTAALQGALNVPVTDTLAVRAAGQYRRHDSYYNDIGAFNDHPGRLDETAGRLSVLWRPGDFQLLIKSDFLVHDLGGFAYRPIVGTPYQAGRTDDARTVDYNTPERQHERAWINGAEGRYTFGGGYTLRVIGGWQDKHSGLLYDSDATSGPVYDANGVPLDQVATDQFVRERQASGEVNLISPTDGPFDWILGGYYQSNKIDVRLAQTAATPLNVDQVQVKHTTGVFAQGNYQLTDRLEVQLGVRYSHFEATGRGAVFIGRGAAGFPPAGIQVADLAGGNKDGRMTGKLALNYKLDSNNLVYAFAARGYKPGGYNSATSFFKPETVWNYEIGWKSTLASGHLRTQIDAFYNDYHGFQFGVIDVTSGQNGVTNLPTATIKGVEGQLQAKFGGFSADVSASFVDSRLPAFNTVNPRQLPAGNLGPQCAPGQAAGPTCFNYAPYVARAGGGSNLLSPRFTWNAGAQYSIPTGGGATLTPRLNYAFVGRQYTGLFYSPTLDLLGSRGLLSALLTYQHGDWRIEGFANNLANKTYVSGQIGNNEVYGSPREYGVRAAIDF
jgi:iron complex outermembrane receptor protein